jgi:hypothetical protein
MAVTAYNAGTKHLLKARRELGADSLENIFTNYDHPHIGFASKNFYAEFLALVHTLAYRDRIFPTPGVDEVFDNVLIGIAKCNFRPDKLFKLGSPEYSQFLKHNPQLLRPNKIYPRGTLLSDPYGTMTHLILPVTFTQMRESTPHKWATKHLRKNHSCSTK